MPGGELGLVVLLIGAAVFWLVILVVTQEDISHSFTLHPIPPAARRQLPDPPLVSILVPARNEEQRVLQPAIRSLLAQDYPNFEVIAVDDRSTDGTLGILKQLADEDSRLRVIQGREPPSGWAGKPHALEQASQAARGQWWLATDADVIFAPEALGTALDFAQRHGYDVVSLLPWIECRSFWDRLLVPVAMFGVRLLYPFRWVNDPTRSHACMAGSFILMRRQAIESISGYVSVQGAISEDMTLAQLFKRAGWRVYLAEAPRLTRTRAHGSPRQIWNAYHKDAFTMIGRRGRYALAGASVGVWLTLLPAGMTALALVTRLGGSNLSWPGGTAVVAYVLMLAAHLRIYQRAQVSGGYALLAFLGYAFLIANLLSSTWWAVTNRSVLWKERHIEATGSEIMK